MNYNIGGTFGTSLWVIPNRMNDPDPDVVAVYERQNNFIQTFIVSYKFDIESFIDDGLTEAFLPVYSQSYQQLKSANTELPLTTEA
jgi:hypothetical protein